MGYTKAQLRKDVEVLKQVTSSERIGVAWQEEDGTIVFKGESFMDPVAFDRVCEANGYTTMYVLRWATNEPEELKSYVGIHKSQI